MRWDTSGERLRRGRAPLPERRSAGKEFVIGRGIVQPPGEWVGDKLVFDGRSDVGDTISYSGGDIRYVEERHLSLSEATEALDISERTAYRWIKSGKLRAYKPGRDYWIPESAVRELVQESEVRPKAPLRSIPWDKAKGECRLAELEEELERLRRLVEDHKRERESMGKANAKMADRAENAEADLERVRQEKMDTEVIADAMGRNWELISQENRMWRRVWELAEEKLERAPLGEEPLVFWGGYRTALLDIRDLVARERGGGDG